MKQGKNRYRFYYKDEVNDDFAKLQIKKTSIDEHYKYYYKNKFAWFLTTFVRVCVIIPILHIISKLCYGTKIKNKKVLKKVKKQGYFIYSNHTTAFDPINHACLVNQSKYTCIIASIETFSIEGLGWFVHFLGAIPVPLSPRMYRNFHDALTFHYEKKHKIVIYPEAHIWPFYTDIRPFKSVSFRYPVELNAPIIVSTTTFKKRKFFKTPKTVIYLDGPFYPNKELKFKEQIEDLRNITYEKMMDRASKDNYAIYDYIKIE